MFPALTSSAFEVGVLTKKLCHSILGVCRLPPFTALLQYSVANYRIKFVCLVEISVFSVGFRGSRGPRG